MWQSGNDLLKGNAYRSVVSFMLFCIAAVQHKTWRIYGTHHTCWFDRLTSKAGQIREGMAAIAAADPLPAFCGT